MDSTRTHLYSLLITITIIAMMLVGVAAFRYSYSSLSALESGVGFIILLVIAGSLWVFRIQVRSRSDIAKSHVALLVGIILGSLWVVEISVNNFIAPPLPARDIIDNIFWAVIAVSILVFSATRAYQRDSILQGIGDGAWSGVVSGLLACCMALLMIVFGMRFILQDPLNVSEWAGIGTSSNAPGMAAYFAFETLAGAFGHLIVLGIGMGALLGVLGGILGKGAKRIVILQQGWHKVT